MNIPNVTTLDHGTSSAPPGQVSFNTLPMSHGAIDMTGGNSNIFGSFALKLGEDEPILIFFKGVGKKTPTRINIDHLKIVGFGSDDLPEFQG